MARADRNASSDARQRRTLQKLSAAGRLHEHVEAETPGGTIDGTNAVFTITFTPAAGSLRLFVSGLLMSGGGNDYTLSDKTVTFVAGAIPGTGETMQAFYTVD